MENVKQTALQSIVLAIDDVRKNFDYSRRPESIKGYCDSIKSLAEAYAIIANNQGGEQTNG